MSELSELSELLAVTEWAPWVTTGPDPDFRTQDLPDSVVGTPFLFSIESRRTSERNPRVGGLWFTLNYGDRMNPDGLLAEDKAYILDMVRVALEALPGRSEADTEAVE